MLYLYIKALHIIAMVAWFAGLFYLPRLFVYHSNNCEATCMIIFKQMERRLYYGIMWPAAIITTFLGCVLVVYNWHYYMTAIWMHIKLLLVMLVWWFHLACGHYVRQFNLNKNSRTTIFYRVFNEIPTILLITIVMLVIIRPNH